MAPNKNSPYRSGVRQNSAQSFDIAPPKRQKKAEFPAVGMTLSSYNKQSNAPRRGSRLTDQPVKTSRWQHLKSKITRKRVILVIVALLVIVGGWLGWKVIYNAHRLFGGNVFSVFSDDKLKGEQNGRVNILLAGNSADDPGHPGGNLTDSIMILSIDTKNNNGYMLSIPRDLYVKIPGNGSGKINSVYPAGEKDNFSEDGYAEGGMGLLEKVIEDNLGITSNYYALVNYNALRDAVNSVDGVEVDITSDDPRGLYDPSRDYSAPKAILVKLSNGKHKLNGQQALNLARARGDARGSYGYANSDFTRTENQRKLILALRSKATSAGVLTNPLKLGKLFDSVGANVKTDLELGNVRRLYEITKKIDSANIQSVGLNDADGVNLLQNYRTPRGESALIPAAGVNDYDDIQRYIQRLTSSNLIVRENADITLLNGTTRSGLAARESDLLDNRNIRVSNVADADTETYTTTQIIDLSGGKKPATLAALKKYFTGSTTTTSNPFGTKYDVDFIVILGSDRLNTSSQSNSSSR
jgi:LCP family protein required for cell wall assembly